VDVNGKVFGAFGEDLLKSDSPANYTNLVLETRAKCQLEDVCRAQSGNASDSF
jgi:hypothetical protein